MARSECGSASALASIFCSRSIDEELAHAEEVSESGVARAKLYEALIKDGKEAQGDQVTLARAVRRQGPMLPSLRFFPLLLLPACAASSPSSTATSSAEALDGPASTMVPISMVQNQVTVQASFGGGAEVSALLDTGSTGVWVDPSVIGGGFTLDPDTSGDVSRTYGGCTRYTGPVVWTSVSLGGLSTMVNVGVTRSVASTGKAGCSAPVPGKVVGEPGLIGIGLRSGSDALANPLVSLTARGRWIVSLDPLGTPSGSLLLNPGAQAVRFTNRVWLSADGGGGWDDTTVPFCVNRFCYQGLVDSGENTPILIAGTTGDEAGDYANLGVPGGSTTVPSGTTLDFTINQANAYSFTVDHPAAPGRDLVRIQTSGFSQNLGVILFRYLDVYYDADDGIIGFADKAD